MQYPFSRRTRQKKVILLGFLDLDAHDKLIWVEKTGMGPGHLQNTRKSKSLLTVAIQWLLIYCSCCQLATHNLSLRPRKGEFIKMGQFKNIASITHCLTLAALLQPPVTVLCLASQTPRILSKQLLSHLSANLHYCCFIHYSTENNQQLWTLLIRQYKLACQKNRTLETLHLVILRIGILQLDCN